MEPQKFFIGVTDFFSILLPGALATYVVKGAVGPSLLGNAYYALPQTEGWAVFLFVSYLLGHFIFLAGSWLLDDAYDAVRKATYQEQVKRLASGKKLSAPWRRRLGSLLFKRDADNAVAMAVRIKESRLGPADRHAINAFQWCKAGLMLHHPDALAAVQRFEADSKFFRSLVVVLLFVFGWGLLRGRLDVALASAVFSVPALWRYVDQRHKATNQAYWLTIRLETDAPSHPVTDAPASGDDDWTHAGGVVVRGQGAQAEYLLVRAKGAEHEWVLPKGHIDPGERAQQAAVREVREEAGVWARIVRPLDGIAFEMPKGQVRAMFYLMEQLAQEKPLEPREHAWFRYDEAVANATHENSRTLLALARERR